MYQQLWGYKVEEKLYLGVREQKRLNTTGLNKLLWTLTLGTLMAHQELALFRSINLYIISDYWTFMNTLKHEAYPDIV
jgi:hypothetical protein